MRKLFRYLHNPILPHLPLETRGGGLFFCYGGGGCWQPWPLDQYRSNKKVSAKAISSSNTYCSSHGGSDAIPFISLIRRQRQKKKKGETFCSLEVCQSSPSALSAESSPKNLKASSKWSLDVQPRHTWAAFFTIHIAWDLMSFKKSSLQDHSLRSKFQRTSEIEQERPLLITVCLLFATAPAPHPPMISSTVPQTNLSSQVGAFLH